METQLLPHKAKRRKSRAREKTKRATEAPLCFFFRNELKLERKPKTGALKIKKQRKKHLQGQQQMSVTAEQQMSSKWPGRLWPCHAI